MIILSDVKSLIITHIVRLWPWSSSPSVAADNTCLKPGTFRQFFLSLQRRRCTGLHVMSCRVPGYARQRPVHHSEPIAITIEAYILYLNTYTLSSPLFCFSYFLSHPWMPTHYILLLGTSHATAMRYEEKDTQTHSGQLAWVPLNCHEEMRIMDNTVALYCPYAFTFPVIIEAVYFHWLERIAYFL